MGDVEAPVPRLPHGLVDRAEGRAPADHGEAAALTAEAHLLAGKGVRDAEYLGSAGLRHLLVVRRRIIDVAGPEILLDAADAVGKAWRAGLHPDAGQLFVPGIGTERRVLAWLLVVEFDWKRLILRHIRHAPWLCGIGDIAV